ncbi:hypothetical protein D3C84_692090 [compost metagenome]
MTDCGIVVIWLFLRSITSSNGCSPKPTGQLSTPIVFNASERMSVIALKSGSMPKGFRDRFNDRSVLRLASNWAVSGVNRMRLSWRNKRVSPCISSSAGGIAVSRLFDRSSQRTPLKCARKPSGDTLKPMLLSLSEPTWLKSASISGTLSSVWRLRSSSKPIGVPSLAFFCGACRLQQRRIRSAAVYRSARSDSPAGA